MADAGWYPDPHIGGVQRYWDGTGWTEHTAPIVAVPSHPAGAVSGVVVSPGGYLVSPKNPALSLFASFLIPGVGSLMNGDTAEGVTILVLFLVSLVLMVVIIGFVTGLAVWVWGMVAAYRGAQRWNAAHGIVS